MTDEFLSAVPEMPVKDVVEAVHEFTAADLDGNLLRVFYDFNWELA